MSAGRKYRKPPVVEALCEVFFTGSEWDDTVPGAFYDRVRDDFPEKRQQQIQEAELQFSPSGETATGFRVMPRMQFRSRAGDRLIQLGRDVLVVNQLTPYPRFDDWEPAIHSALEHYRQLASPKGFVRMGLRYINRISLPGPWVAMEDYFTVYPNLPAGMGTEHGSFLVRVEVHRDGGHTVVLSFGTSPGERDGELAQLLDLYDVLRKNPPGDLKEIQAEVKVAHENVEAAFETSITDKLRALFEPEANR